MDSEQLTSEAPISKKVLENKLIVEADTPRLFIKSYTPHDFEECVTLYGNSHITKYFDHGAPRTRSEVKSYVNQRGTFFLDNKEPFGLYSVFLQDRCTFIGQVDMVPSDEPGTAEIGWIFKKEYQGKGYCSEAVLSFLIPLARNLAANQVCILGQNIDTLVATAHPDNKASKAIIRKIGMTFVKSQERYGGKPRYWYTYKLEQPDIL